MNRATSLRMLDNRSEYEDPRASQELQVKEGGVEGFRNGPVPVRSRPKVASIWIHPHEMASRDYFWGGWMSVVIEQDSWVLSKPGSMPSAPGITEIPPEGVKRKTTLKTLSEKPKLKSP